MGVWRPLRRTTVVEWRPPRLSTGEWRPPRWEVRGWRLPRVEDVWMRGDGLFERPQGCVLGGWIRSEAKSIVPINVPIKFEIREGGSRL